MGAIGSTTNSPELRELVQAANFSERELKKLYKRFKELDTDDDGLLSVQELFDIPIIAENPLVQRVLAVFDANSDDKVSFIEFLAGLAKLATNTDDTYQKTKFAFDMYDINKDGFITNGELFKVMRLMIGTNLNDQQLQQLIDRTIIKADKDNDGMVSFDEFAEMVSHLDFTEKFQIEMNS